MTCTRRSLVGFALSAPAAFAQRPRPNVIVIVADDLGYADVGFQGARDIPTPHLDALARGGVRCTNGYVSHPFCSPTRAGLLTGRYQQRFGHENNPLYDPNDERLGLPLTEKLLPEVLAKGGYRTGLVGKWHLGAAPQFHPRKRGFQEHFGFIGGGHQYFEAQMSLPAREYFVPVERDGEAVNMEGKYLTDELTSAATEFVNRNAQRPFFLYLAYNAPHTPQQVTDRYLDRVKGIASEKRRKHAAMVTSVDDGVGAVMEALRKHRLEENTVVVFLSDNGGPTAVTEADNGPLRGGKGQVYEGGIRVPFVVAWKGRLRPREYPEPVTSLDIFPTVCAVAGVRPAGAKRLDGVNLIPYLAGKSAEAPHQRLFWRTGGGVSYAVREGNWKLVMMNGKMQLFDLAKDTGETQDLSAAKPDVLARLDKARAAWDRELVKPLFESPQAAKKKTA